jgi:hypothetical protein
MGVLIILTATLRPLKGLSRSQIGIGSSNPARDMIMCTVYSELLSLLGHRFGYTAVYPRRLWTSCSYILHALTCTATVVWKQGLALSIGPNRTDFTWRRRQIPGSEKSWFIISLGRWIMSKKCFIFYIVIPPLTSHVAKLTHALLLYLASSSQNRMNFVHFSCVCFRIGL